MGSIRTLDLEAETMVVSGWYNADRREMLLGVTGAVYRQIGTWGRWLAGACYGAPSHIGTTSAVHLLPFVELFLRPDLGPG